MEVDISHAGLICSLMSRTPEDFGILRLVNCICSDGTAMLHRSCCHRKLFALDGWSRLVRLLPDLRTRGRNINTYRASAIKVEMLKRD